MEGTYDLQLIEDVGLLAAKSTATPMDPYSSLSTYNGEEFSDTYQYQRLVGRMLYLKITRLDISFVVQHLSQFMHAPKKSHYDAALHVVRYIKGQPGLGLLMSSKKIGKINAFCDADWASSSLSRRSVTGFGIKF